MWCTNPLQAVFTQLTPVLSLGFDLWNLRLSSQHPPVPAGEQTSLLGWWMLAGTDPPCGNLSALPSAPLLLCSPLWFQSFSPHRHLQSPRVKVLPSVWKPYLLHSSLPLVQVPSLFFCLCVFFLFRCPTQIHGEFFAFWEVWVFLLTFSRCFVGVVPHVDVFLMYLWGGRWSPLLTLPPSWRSLVVLFF